MHRTTGEQGHEKRPWVFFFLQHQSGQMQKVSFVTMERARKRRFVLQTERCSAVLDVATVRTLKITEIFHHINTVPAAEVCGLRKTSAAGRAGCWEQLLQSFPDLSWLIFHELTGTRSRTMRCMRHVHVPDPSLLSCSDMMSPSLWLILVKSGFTFVSHSRLRAMAERHPFTPTHHPIRG